MDRILSKIQWSNVKIQEVINNNPLEIPKHLDFWICAGSGHGHGVPCQVYQDLEQHSSFQLF